MKTFVSKPDTMSLAEWNGSEDEQLVTDLRAAGWTVLFQHPAQGQEAQVFNEETSEWGMAPAPSRMIVVGPYRGQSYNVDAGNWLVWHENAASLNASSKRDLADRWDEVVGVQVTWPTPDQLFANQSNERDFF